MKYTKPEISVTFLNNEEYLMVSVVPINLKSFKLAGDGNNPKFSTVNFS